MDADTRLKTEEKIIAMLKTVYEPYMIPRFR